MRSGVFVDTSCWFALTSDRDRDHSLASRRFRRLATAGRPLVTTNQVIGESFTLMRRRLGSKPALDFLSGIRSSMLVRRVFVSQAWEEEAERLLEQYADQSFSFVDATSFVTMRHLQIHDALAFDSDFVVAGFGLVYDRDVANGRREPCQR